MRFRTLIRKLRPLAWSDRIAFLRAAVLLLGVRMALKVLPFRSMLSWADGPERDQPRQRPLSPETRRFVHAVETVGHRLFPRNPCLTQAVLVQRHLRTRGHASDLRIGVRKGAAMTLEAHAWVESDGEVVVGRKGMAEDHVTFPPLTRHRGSSS